MVPPDLPRGLGKGLSRFTIIGERAKGKGIKAEWEHRDEEPTAFRNGISGPVRRSSTCSPRPTRCLRYDGMAHRLPVKIFIPWPATPRVLSASGPAHFPMRSVPGTGCWSTIWRTIRRGGHPVQEGAGIPLSDMRIVQEMYASGLRFYMPIDIYRAKAQGSRS